VADKPITLVSRSLLSHQRKQLKKAGFVEHCPNKYVFTKDTVRIVMQRKDDNWRQTIDVLCGTRVLDMDEDLNDGEG
jgi:hypothetical protein